MTRRGPRHPQIILAPLSARPGRDAPGHARAGATPGIASHGGGRTRAGASGSRSPTAPSPARRTLAGIRRGRRCRPSAGGAAVLVALFEESGETRVVLTRRLAQLRSHTTGVVPGGKLDPARRARSALREGEEEVGLPADASSPAGWLRPASSFASARSSCRGHHLGTSAETRGESREVDRVFDVALRPVG